VTSASMSPAEVMGVRAGAAEGSRSSAACNDGGQGMKRLHHALAASATKEAASAPAAVMERAARTSCLSAGGGMGILNGNDVEGAEMDDEGQASARVT
jgi:hypothetical protein